MEAMQDLNRRRTLLHAAYDSSTVRAMERPLLDRGVPLMRMAAGAAAHVAAQMLDDENIDIEDAAIVLLVGGGDNGGDGLYAAAALADEGAQVTAIAVGTSVHEAGFAAFVRAGGRTLVLDPAADIPGIVAGFSAGEAAERVRTAIDIAEQADLIIDAMTGIGLRGPLRGLPGTMAALLGVKPDENGHVPLPDRPALPNRENDGHLPLVLAIDTPSGIGVNDGTLPGPVIPADVTVMFGAMKPCAMLPPATFACGRLVLVDFSFDLSDQVPVAVAVDDALAEQAIRLPRVTDSKYSRGVVGLVTGSTRYPGAAVLSCEAAARANTGMIRYLGPERAQNMVLAAIPEAVIGKGHVQSWTIGCGAPDAHNAEPDDIQRATAAALLEHYALSADADNTQALAMPPIVVDAGALDMLPKHVPAHVVITPHAGELAELANRLADDGQAQRSSRASHAGARRSEPIAAQNVMDEPLHYARFAADSTGATVLLKGAVTMVVSPACKYGQSETNDAGSPIDVSSPTRAVAHTNANVDTSAGTQPVLVCGSAPAWLATAGAGDVLAGLIGGLLAGNAVGDNGWKAEDIARIAASGAYVHGMAAAIASESEQHGWQEPDLFGQAQPQRFTAIGHPIIASDVARAIGDALADIIA
ncbi:bifunctional ADP-dependent NAD(P)H-hydrate dehydratase/NAD(P)H-hydrate epimerase [Bifidobacterium oedipodis]|uniref:ADP-dependent (S)-NAD(P)H-hydrate dehydratase n=1 Tax=Bifidobacterium oedipodis TaxID=2675322 RepID=A0A7Y0EPX0_9BIFI|nr:bifunctional ADP-dependent NAD(P)H-hydrate dehydratase/NAD(P)H-hydrate epimerase [Bifidobacterium sp. DSM 109957]NMM94283.1 carbohydrate kinase [Bifidobacterium sp. DSM 109957]